MVRKATLIDGGALLLAVVLSLVAFDLIPGPTALLAVIVGAAAWLEIRRGRPAGRRLVEAFAGMMLALAVVLVLASVVH